jgi:hypothetical protein
MDFRDENAPHFILNLIEEFQREKITESIAPCQTFAKSFMMISPATGRKDLTLLLRPLSEDSMNRLETWRNNQGEQVVMILSDYVKQYAVEFTGIGKPAAVNDVEKKIEQKDDNGNGNNLPSKSKKNRRKRNRHPEEINNSDDDADAAENESEPSTSATNDNDDTLEVSDEPEGDQ